MILNRVENFFFFLPHHAAWQASQFPSQGLNVCHGSETRVPTIGPHGISHTEQLLNGTLLTGVNFIICTFCTSKTHFLKNL